MLEGRLWKLQGVFYAGLNSPSMVGRFLGIGPWRGVLQFRSKMHLGCGYFVGFKVTNRSRIKIGTYRVFDDELERSPLLTGEMSKLLFELV